MKMMPIDVLRPPLCTVYVKWVERPRNVTKRCQRWNTLRIWPRRDSNSGGSDLWPNALPIRLRRTGDTKHTYKPTFYQRGSWKNGTTDIKFQHVLGLLISILCQGIEFLFQTRLLRLGSKLEPYRKVNTTRDIWNELEYRINIHVNEVRYV